MTKIEPADMDAIMREIARRLQSFAGYPYAFHVSCDYLKRDEVFGAIAKAIAIPPAAEAT